MKIEFHRHCVDKQPFQNFKPGKGLYFSESGKVVNKIGFLIEGIMCVRYYGVNGKDITKYFIVENHFAADINSFRFETPSPINFEALTDCKLIIFSKETFLLLADLIDAWNDIFAAIFTAYLTEKFGSAGICSPWMPKHGT